MLVCTPALPALTGCLCACVTVWNVCVCVAVSVSVSVSCVCVAARVSPCQPVPAKAAVNTSGMWTNPFADAAPVASSAAGVGAGAGGEAEHDGPDEPADGCGALLNVRRFACSTRLCPGVFVCRVWYLRVLLAWPPTEVG